MFGLRAPQRWIYPITVWLVLLVVIFAAEYGVMLILPWLLPHQSSRFLESVVDSVVLTLVLAPVLWWTLVRPLQEVIRLRSEFLADLFAQIEIDRRQTARELHDGVGQALTLLISGLRSAKACRVNMECAGRVEGFQHLAENALTEVRRLALGLRPSLLDDLGLAPALERLVEDVRSHHPMSISLNVADVISNVPRDPVATAIFRIVQEALANVIKHSQAKQVAVTVSWSQANVIVEINDDGSGIAPARLRALPPGHIGLRGMRERAVLLGGSFDIDSAPGLGTRLTVTLLAEGGKRG
jgi:signal transduction histidine kinase